MWYINVSAVLRTCAFRLRMFSKKDYEGSTPCSNWFSFFVFFSGIVRCKPAKVRHFKNAFGSCTNIVAFATQLNESLVFGSFISSLQTHKHVCFSRLLMMTFLLDQHQAANALRYCYHCDLHFGVLITLRQCCNCYNVGTVFSTA